MSTQEKTSTKNDHTSWYMAALITAFAGIVITTLMAYDSRYHLPAWEVDAFRAINNWPQWLYPLGLSVTVMLGSVWTAIGSVLIATACKAYTLAWRLAVVIIGGYGLDFILKHGVERGRPEDMLLDIHKRSVETGAGFPSGHTTVAVVLALVLLPYLPKAWRWIVIVWIVLTALSRIYLGVHLPLDVIGAVFVGVFVVSFTRVMPQKLKVLLRLAD